MNLEFFHNTSAIATGCWVRFRHDFQAGCLGILRLFSHRDGMSGELDVALQKRELEMKLLASGYSLKLAKIAVAEAFTSPAQPI